MKTIKLAISSAGSGIAQSIIDSCRLSNLPISIYGLDINPLAFGLHDCDHKFIVPRLDDPQFLTKLLKICTDNEIDMIIPGTDQEALFYSEHKKVFKEHGVTVIASDLEFLQLTRDKVACGREFEAYADIFVKGYYSKASFKAALKAGIIDFPVIAKPGSGSGSIGITILNAEEDLDALTDEHIIQELAEPNKNDPNAVSFTEGITKGENTQVSELSIQLLADDKGDVMGRMISVNKLKAGIPVEIVPIEDERIWKAIDPLLKVFKQKGWKGPLNIQGRWTNNGLKIFEMNARFTGITGLRALMGFNEVEACIKVWLSLNKEPLEVKVNKDLIGLRQTKNKAITKSDYTALDKSKELAKSQRPVLLLTGATGYVGRNLIEKCIKERSSFELWALVRDKNKAIEILPSQVQIFDQADWERGDLQLGLVHTLLHCGFARPFKSNTEVAESLKFTERLFNKAVDFLIPRIINISSQAVYGQGEELPWTEETPVAPNSPYAMAKYASEVCLKSLTATIPAIDATSIRLTGISGGAKGLINVDLVSRFVDQVKNNQDINVTGGMQVFERMHIQDVVSALMALIESDSNSWKPVYNLGSDETVTLLDLAKHVIDQAKTYNTRSSSALNLEEKFVDQKFGMDSSRFFKQFNWKPKHSIHDIINSLFEFDYS